MTFYQYIKIVKAKLPVILVVVLSVLILTVGATLVFGQPFKYRSTVQLLVVQKQSPAVDAYTAIRSAEKMADNLSAVVSTSSFLGRTLEAPYQTIDTLPSDPVKRKKAWEKTVETRVVPETGILEVSVYHPSRNQAVAYAQAVAWVLVNQSGEYHGGGSDVEIRNIDAPLTSNHPVRPNIFANMALAVALGLIVSLIVLYLMGEESALNAAPTRLSVHPVSVATDMTTHDIPVKAVMAVDNSDEPMIVSPSDDMTFEEYKAFIQKMYSTDSRPSIVTMHDHQ